jgi:hypothetical protein
MTDIVENGNSTITFAVLSDRAPAVAALDRLFAHGFAKNQNPRALEFARRVRAAGSLVASSADRVDALAPARHSGTASPVEGTH